MDGVPTFGEYIRERRTAARLTRQQLAWLANLSVPYLTKIEGGSVPSRRVVESLGAALELQLAEREYALALAEGPIPEFEDNQPTAIDIEYLHLLEPHLAAYVTPTLDVLAANAAFTETFSELRTGDNALEWLMLNPVARTVILDWERLANDAVGSLRLMVARFGLGARSREIIEHCMASPEFEALWQGDGVAAIPNSRPMLVRNPKTLAIREFRENSWRTQSGMHSWSLYLAMVADRPHAVTRPVVRERPGSSTGINERSGDGAWVRPPSDAPRSPGNPVTQPIPQISSNQKRE
ncbi:helix-turn-helix transcriptional regulator [Nocardia sp. NPDC050406]|uniref:helix-turn-helix transcriptional regulator n=1 Tax=Nocardia sp. NPDC050406 TaxID=3364318 RepID=UPI0037B05715